MAHFLTIIAVIRRRFKITSIKSIRALEVLNSRGNPAVEVSITTEKGYFRAVAPNGASAGKHEALELRDGGKRYLGLGVSKAVNNVNKLIAPKFIGKAISGINEVDRLLIRLDGTENKSRLGANAILPVSMACCQALAASSEKFLFEYIAELYGTKPSLMPVPMMNIVNGGKHAGQDNDIQEHMIIPVKAKSFPEALQMGCETYHHLRNILKERYGARGTLIADEGGFVPMLKTVQERLDIMAEAIDAAGYSDNMVFAIDSASSEFFDGKNYTIEDKKYSAGEMIDFYSELCKRYHVASIEDPLAEDDWDAWAAITKKLGKKVQLVGDDLLVTNTKRIKKAIELKACNAVLIKPNQIGTVTETLDAIRITQKSGMNAIISHRSGETAGTFIADLAVGTNAGQCKFGAPARSDRNTKYNQLLRIGDNLKGAKYRDFRK